MKKLITFAIVMLLILGLMNSSLSVVSIRSEGSEESLEEEYTLEINTAIPFAETYMYSSKGGTTDPSPGSHNFSQSVEVTVRAIPERGWRFTHWSGDIPEERSEEQEITISMDADKTLTANFRILEEDEYLGSEKEIYGPGENITIEVKNDNSADNLPIINDLEIYIQKVETGEIVFEPSTDIVQPAPPSYGYTEYVIWNQTDPDNKQVSEGDFIVKAENDEFNHTAEFQISKVTPELEVSNLRMEPEKPREGEQIELMVDVKNSGNETSEYRFEFYVYLPCRVSFNRSETVTLESGETETISITFPAVKSGEYHVEVDGFEETILVDFEGDESNFLIDIGWLLVMMGFVISLVILVPWYEEKQHDEK